MLFSIEIYNDNEKYDTLLVEFQENKRMLFAAAYDILHDSYYVEDILQDAYVSILKNIERFISLPGGKRGAFIYVCVRNTAINFYNKHKKETGRVLWKESMDDYSNNLAPPEETVISQESISYLMEAIKDIDEKYRSVLILSTHYKICDEEISSILGVSVDVVRVRRYRGRQILKKALQEGSVRDV